MPAPLLLAPILEALGEYQRAVDLTPDWVAAPYNYANALAGQKRYDYAPCSQLEADIGFSAVISGA
jgi:hypothetical protein